ncbi:phage baseplate assembly protein [Methylobacterium gnaphalii]|uniref:Baseplate hub protein gp44/GpP-like second domain-containing protein n=1 Tax=Methylobacterium gnaphalii TaxID=1010610 RepID=A0A512JIP2_9HYPH|nr:hypothetical protein [Methylobacterium gnaphalii]GEP09804.1 hypothetical protein MGN01_16490 [Methylobacterium gnaphalii]GJD67281.1 hypothetical protein MMMDOFMJ_0195 [Methylobacterium gnaphalii]GLS49834.1 hypothetical protein GCM10007885_26860 [Methylobacterium gnaphalii]
MPSADLICEVRTEGGTYSDWLTVEVSQSWDAEWMRNFRLTCAEPSDKLLQRLLPGSRVDIAMAGQVVIQEGYIKTRQAAFDSNRHAVQIVGYSKAGRTVYGSAEAGTGQFRGYKIDAIANRLLKQHGLNFRVENGPSGWDTPFPNVVIRYGETPFDAISRLCRQRGLWLRADKAGNYVAGVSDGGDGAMFQEGVNILSANCSIEDPSVDNVIMNAQQSGSDSLFGRKASEISAKSQLSGGSGLGLSRKVLAEMPLGQKELQLRTNMESAALEADRVRVTLSYQGWLKPSGSLWDLGDWATVRSPMLFPLANPQMRLKLWGYTYAQSPEGQTTTAIELVNAGAFQLKNPDGQQSDGFLNPSASDAQPEAYT